MVEKPLEVSKKYFTVIIINNNRLTWADNWHDRS